MMVTISINGAEVEIELDTAGVLLSVISQVTYNNLCSAQEAPVIRKSDVKLTIYTGERVPIPGVINVKVVYDNQEKEVELVVQGSGPNLMGRDWRDLYQVKQPTEKWREIVNRHPEVFQEELGQVKQVKAKIYVGHQANPSFYV